jgi:hypothetical protein
MKEHEVNKLNNFIMGWYIDISVCDKVLGIYNNPNTIKNVGLSQNPYGPTPEIKDSTDAIIPPNIKVIQPYLNELKTCLDRYTEKYVHSSGQAGYSLKECMNIQHYPIGGGFKVWHAERCSADEFIRDRHLVFMTYLNDVEDGGTEFFYQGLTIKAEKGLTLVWPADWTFTHKGQISNTTEKTIITGWITYN